MTHDERYALLVQQNPDVELWVRRTVCALPPLTEAKRARVEAILELID